MPFTNQRSPSAPIIYGDISLDPSDGSITGTTGNFEDVNIGGDSVAELIQNTELQPTGTDMLFRLYGQSPVMVQRNQELFTITRTFSGTRDYTMTTPSIRIDYTSSRTAANFADRYVQLEVKATSANSPNANWTHITYAYSVALNWRVYVIPSETFEIVKTHLAADPVITFTATITSSAAADYGAGWRLSVTGAKESSFIIEDLGTITERKYGSLDLGSLVSNAPPPPPTPTEKDYSGDFYATHYATYSLNSGANQTSDYPGMILQSSTITPRIGMTAFNNRDQHGRNLSDLRAANVKITGIGIYIGAAYNGVNTKWYYSSGGIGRLYWHGNKAQFPGSGIPVRTFIQEITNWKNNQERSVNVFNAVRAAIDNGTFGGFALSGEGKTGQNTYHGEFPYRMRMRINYTVTS